MASPDKTECMADGRDLVFVEISAVDEDGIYVANANNRVNVSVSGAAYLAGLDNGDSTDYDSYKADSRRMFGGKLLAVIAAGMEAGIITVKLSSAGMEDKIITINALPAQDSMTQGVSRYSDLYSENRVEDNTQAEIPIRKLELIASGQTFDIDNNTIEVKLKIQPSDATFDDIKWRVTDDRGVDSGLAKISVNEDSVSVIAVADGAFRLRCNADNGRIGFLFHRKAHIKGFYFTKQSKAYEKLTILYI